MNFHQLQNQWQSQDDELDRAIILGPMEKTLAQSRFPGPKLGMVGVSLGGELVFTLCVFAIFAALLLQMKHLDLSFAFAMAILVVTGAQGVAVVSQILSFTKIDVTDSLTSVHDRLLKLKISRLRSVKWSFFAWMFLWIPFLLVILKGIFGVDIGPSLDASWLIGNAIFGFASIGLIQIVIRFYGDRLESIDFLRRSVDSLAGRSLARALQSLEDAERFQDPEA